MNEKTKDLASIVEEKNAAVCGIPIISKALARARVARLERAVSRFRMRTSAAVGRLATECGHVTAIQAKLLAAREALRSLAPQDQEPLLRRITEAESRLEAIRPLCQLPRQETATPRGDLSGGSDASEERSESVRAREPVEPHGGGET